MAAVIMPTMANPRAENTAQHKKTSKRMYLLDKNLFIQFGSFANNIPNPIAIKIAITKAFPITIVHLYLSWFRY